MSALEEIGDLCTAEVKRERTTCLVIMQDQKHHDMHLNVKRADKTPCFDRILYDKIAQHFLDPNKAVFAHHSQKSHMVCRLINKNRRRRACSRIYIMQDKNTTQKREERVQTISGATRGKEQDTFSCYSERRTFRETSPPAGSFLLNFKHLRQRIKMDWIRTTCWAAGQLKLPLSSGETSISGRSTVTGL